MEGSLDSTKSDASGGVSRRLLMSAVGAAPAACALPINASRAASDDPLVVACQAWLTRKARQEYLHRTHGTVEERVWAQIPHEQRSDEQMRACADGRLLLSMEAELEAWPSESAKLLRRIRRMRAQNIDGVVGKLQITADGMDAEHDVYEHRVLVSAIADVKRLFSL